MSIKFQNGSIIIPPMSILALDPSSTCCGFADLRPDGSLRLAGLIEPDKRQAASYDRILSLRRLLRQVLEQQHPGLILIEWTKGKVGHRRHHGNGAGLAVYGCGVGALATEAEHWVEGISNTDCRPKVVYVLENDWTRGEPKEHRQLAIASLYPEYLSTDDPGGDIADAIGLAHWYIKEMIFNKT
jgi:hypothetical protein